MWGFGSAAAVHSQPGGLYVNHSECSAGSTELVSSCKVMARAGTVQE